jgi:hypothetical protein
MWLTAAVERRGREGRRWTMPRRLASVHLIDNWTDRIHALLRTATTGASHGRLERGLESGFVERPLPRRPISTYSLLPGRLVLAAHCILGRGRGLWFARGGPPLAP